VLGRQADGEPPPNCLVPAADARRVVLAPLADVAVSRRHARLEWLADGRLILTNLSERITLQLSDGGNVKPRASCDLTLPAVITLGSRVVRVQLAATTAPVHLQSLDEATRAPHTAAVFDAPSTFPVPGAGGVDLEAVVRWLQVTLALLQSAAGANDFFDKAARAVVDLVGMDVGCVLLWEGSEWKTQAVYPVGDVPVPSQRVLDRVRTEKRTFWEVPDPAATAAGSLAGLQAVVAAPVLDPGGEDRGALYGHRRQRSSAAPQITKLEAMLVEVLAGGLATGLARLKQQQAAMAAQVRFEQFFTPELARQLTRQPDLLNSREQEVTVLFSDVRGFSRISERLGTAATGEWFGEVLEALSGKVHQHRGVLIDYIGDELMALWGAPEEQPDHARLACHAALDMLNELAELNARWQERVGEPTQLGIGVHTGVAQVGNSGSKYKFKYGPRGHTVNLASRVQGATKSSSCGTAYGSLRVVLKW
jgi:adenylate cyclase